MEKWSASCIIKEMNITTPMRSLSRLDWFVSLLIIVLVRCKEIRIFIKNGYRLLEGSLTVTIKFNTNAWSRTNILFLNYKNSFIIYSSEIETEWGRVDACLCILASLESKEEREHWLLSLQKVFLQKGGGAFHPVCKTWTEGEGPDPRVLLKVAYFK